MKILLTIAGCIFLVLACVVGLALLFAVIIGIIKAIKEGRDDG